MPWITLEESKEVMTICGCYLLRTSILCFGVEIFKQRRHQLIVQSEYIGVYAADCSFSCRGIQLEAADLCCSE